MTVAASVRSDGDVLTRASFAGFARTTLDRAAATAASRAPHWFRVAGHTVCVRFGSVPLVEAYTARIGMAIPPDAPKPAPDFVFDVLSGADVGMPVLPTWADPNWHFRLFENALAAQGLVSEFPYLPNLYKLYDSDAGHGVLLMGSIADLPLWHGGAPLVDLVRFAIARKGIRVVHGATLGTNGKGMLFVGDGGAGKSGTTLAGLRAGLASVGDDYVAIGFEDDVPVARQLYSYMKQDRAGLGRHAGHAVADAPGEPNWHGKIEFDPRDYFPGALQEKLELRAVVIPRISERAPAPAVEPVTASEALRVAMRTNLFWGNVEDGMKFFARLLRLPRYRVTLVPDPVANGAELRRLAESL